MKPKELETQPDHLAEVIPVIASFLEKKGAEFYPDKNEFKNFILATCVNLLGNFAMHLSEDTIESKLNTTACTVERLMEWYKISMTHYRIQKEAH